MNELENNKHKLKIDVYAANTRRTSHIKRLADLVACLCLCICCTVPVIAAEGNSFAYEMLYSISPRVAQKLKPINVSSIDKGIEMKIVAAEVAGENANILVSMHDKVGSRIDESVDLFDSYSIHTPYDQSGGCSLVGYDADSQTATFLISFESDPNIRGWAGEERNFVDKENVQFIKPEEKNAIALEEGVLLTGFGMVHGKLHMQLRYANILSTDNHGDVYLKNQEGEKIICEESISFWDDSNTDSYWQVTFPILMILFHF